MSVLEFRPRVVETTYAPPTRLDTIADLHGQLMAAQDHLGVALEALVLRGTPIQPAELQALLEGS